MQLGSKVRAAQCNARLPRLIPLLSWASPAHWPGLPPLDMPPILPSFPPPMCWPRSASAALPIFGGWVLPPCASTRLCTGTADIRVVTNFFIARWRNSWADIRDLTLAKHTVRIVLFAIYRTSLPRLKAL